MTVIKVRLPGQGHLLGEEARAEIKATDSQRRILEFAVGLERHLETKRRVVNLLCPDQPTAVNTRVKRPTDTGVQRCLLQLIRRRPGSSRDVGCPPPPLAL